MPDTQPLVGSAPGVELRETYARRFAGAEQRRLAIWKTLNRYFFQRWVSRDDTVLDLGAGYCEYINSIDAKQKIAIDLNPATATCADIGTRVITQDVGAQWDIDPASVDVIFTSNFLEHLPTKAVLAHCLQEAARVLRPGGAFIALGPNIRFAYDEYWDFFDHYLPLSDRSLVEALEICGFKIEGTVIPRFLPYTMSRGLPPIPCSCACIFSSRQHGEFSESSSS